jgi:hypothetical protein
MEIVWQAGSQVGAMKKFFTIILCFLNGVVAWSQADEQKLTTTMKEFHQALVKKNTVSINQQTDKALSYGHSNGWIQTKSDVINDLENGLIAYHSFKEDSVRIAMNGSVANVRFVADINATMRGTNYDFHLRVLEVWVKKGKRWILFARQAIR